MFNLKINFKTEDTPVIIKDLENFFTNFSIVQQPNKNIKTINLFLNETVPEQDLHFVSDPNQVENIWYTYFHNLIIEDIDTIEVINTELNKDWYLSDNGNVYNTRLENTLIKPGESKVFPTGLKVSMNDDEVFNLYIRSSLGYKYNVTLTNGVGVIDSDYYNNSDNEGHFKLKLTNHGDKELEVKIGDRIAQGIFMKYLIVDDEEEIINERIGGIGSTNKEGK